MMSLCLRYTKNEEDAMEALNTGFYKVFKNIHQYDPQKGNLYTWIRTIIVHSCLDAVRNNTRFPVAAELPLEIDSGQVIPLVLSELQARDVLGLVRKLPPASQAVFNLFVIDGFSHAEIASLLGISEGTSRWHLSMARQSIQQSLGAVNS